MAPISHKEEGSLLGKSTYNGKRTCAFGSQITISATGRREEGREGEKEGRTYSMPKYIASTTF